MRSFILVCRKVRRDYPNLWAHRKKDRKVMVAYWLPSCGLAPVTGGRLKFYVESVRSWF